MEDRLVSASLKNFRGAESMQFHEYTSIKRRILRNADPAARKQFGNLNASQFRGTIIKTNMQGNDEGRIYGYQAGAEGIWAENDRPYYNVWPIAISLAESVKLTLPFSSVQLPFSKPVECVGGTLRTTALLLRFARGHEPAGLHTALLDWNHTDNLIFFHAFAGDTDELSLWERYEPDESVETWLERLMGRPQYGGDWNAKQHSDATGLKRLILLVRLVTFISLLAKGDDVITPIVLAKDRDKYESTDDPDVKRWLENRAAKLAGRGFDVGKRLELERETSPHFRNPHMCLFWTGEGRTIPVLQLRSGAVIQKVSMADVPTGYFGPETDDELVIDPDKTPRESFSKSRRFAILKRDAYRCQICGRSQDDGAKLHVDHRIALAKGGSNEDDNLWTLCDTCNLGKSDKSL